MPYLKPNPTLSDLQQYIREMEDERGFASDTTLQKCILLGEEVGELFKSIRKEIGVGVDDSSRFRDIAHELPDIFIVLCTIANRYNIDLEEAFREKEEINKKRAWTKHI